MMGSPGSINTLKEVICWVLTVAIVLMAPLIVLLIIDIQNNPGGQEQPLLVKVTSFNVSQFWGSNFMMSACWDLDLLLANKEPRIDILIEESNCFLKYKNDCISCATLEKMHLAPETQKLVRLRFDSTSCNGEQPYVRDDTMKEMRKEADDGDVVLSLVVDLYVVYDKALVFDYAFQLEPECQSLNMTLDPKRSAGTMLGEPRLCIIQWE